MHIGFDFDNTIVCYDHLFHLIARDMGLIDSNMEPNKVLIRDHLRSMDKEPIWTEIQGLVYGQRMVECDPFPGFLDALKQLSERNLNLSIVSHKTRFPYAGPQYDLHATSKAWIEKKITAQVPDAISPDQVYFEATKTEKVKKIAQIECDVYVDDLPEILLHEDFPTSTKRILFDPLGSHSPSPEYILMRDWRDFEKLLTPQTC